MGWFSMGIKEKSFWKTDFEKPPYPPIFPRTMIGYHFHRYVPDEDKRTPFDRLLPLFVELLNYTSGDPDEALNWMEEIDKQQSVFPENYGRPEFEQELKRKGYLREEPGKNGKAAISAKSEQAMRKQAMEQLFGKMKKSGAGKHSTSKIGAGDEATELRRPYVFGDKSEQIQLGESLKNAQINHGIDDFQLTESDLEVVEQEHNANASTVVMIDISHSMILYGEDRITPAKKVSMALAEWIMKRYPKDTLDIVVFGDDAWPIQVKDLPYLQVGPYHTNTVAGLELAMDILRRKKASNKQIFMITDGKPSCLKENGEYYKNSWGLDPYIVGKCLNLARQCRKMRIPITTFMLTDDPYLQQFIEEFTEANQGKALYTGLKGLGDSILRDYEKNRRKKL
jgi:Ca-activated chloride channel homolog